MRSGSEPEGNGSDFHESASASDGWVSPGEEDLDIEAKLEHAEHTAADAANDGDDEEVKHTNADPDDEPTPQQGPGFDPSHTYVWLTRTNRQAQCVECNGAIAAWEFRALYCPHTGTVQDKRRLSNLWWKYHHIGCIVAKVTREMASFGIQVDAMRKHVESEEDFSRLCDKIMHHLLATLRQQSKE